ncbi:NAD(P)/FAD-dependent oxidoreductase, partial [Escherichia coli]
KGSHAAIKSGKLAAEAAFDALVADRRQDELAAYPEAFKNSWLHAELNKARNFKQWFKKGRTVATLMTGIEQLVFKGKMPWTLRHSKPDHACLQPASQCARIDYPKPD